MRIAAVDTVVPDHRYSQAELTEAFARLSSADHGLLRRFHEATQITGRSLALPLEDYERLDGFTAANDQYVTHALDLAERAVKEALARSGTAPEQIDHLVWCSSTGVATPSLDARLAQRVGLRPDVKRVPVFGLGCAGGAAGLARMNDLLLGHPLQAGLVVCVELCSLTVQREDTSVANLVASGLFGDGAGAVVAWGDERSPTTPDQAVGPSVIATRSRLYPDTERIMGWEVGEHGFRIVLAADLVELVEAELAGDVTGFLADHGLSPAEVTSWVCHPGGPKVIEAIDQVLSLRPGALDLTWHSLQAIGNLSSVSVLNVLQETIARRPGEPGEHGLLMALGPGFSAELVLLRW
ncbi:type III polyketide synthase [Nonomuraea sp. NPDC050328]|uniref:type III polyketide synthase n=1 Tax=Nonomuraea sp. NPDC050328 TaxID=3364361 RepID=UPI003793CE10